MIHRQSNNQHTPQHKRVEEELFPLAAIVESCEDAIFSKTLDGLVLSWNTGAQRLYGYSAHEMIGHSIHTIVPLERRQQLADIMQRLSEGHRIAPFETVHSRKDGCLVDVSVTISPLRDATGKIVGASTIARDITERKQMETQRKLAPRMNWSEMPASEHFVQFYETDKFLLDSLSEFIGTGLSAGNACIVIATKAHREHLEERLKANGLDLAAAYAQDEYIWLDAGETLSQFMVDGLPESERLIEVVGSTIVQAAKGQRPVRIFGEMVALLWMEGNQTAAIQLEKLWNDLQRTTPSFSLFCAYPMHGFAGEVYSGQFTEICQQHASVIPDESYTLLCGPDELLRATALLQQKAHSLEAEIVERKRAEERLRISEKRYRRLFEVSKDGILLVDSRTGTITDANPSMTELLGYPHEQLLGQELWQIGLFEDRQAALEVLRQLQEQQCLHYETVLLHTKDGQPRYVEFVSTVYQANGHEVIQCNLRDITARWRAEEALRVSEERFRMLATTDPETGLPNHRALIARLDQELERAHCYERSCSLLFLDLDHFKALNDGYGHAVGDAVLCEFADLVRTQLRGMDTMGRWGGEEFLVILPELQAEAALHVAEVVRTTVAAHTFRVGGGLHLTCSIGLASYPVHAREREGLLNAADWAMYGAKRFGRNQVRAATDPAVLALFPAGRTGCGQEEAALLGMAEALVTLVEARDHLTGHHSHQVADLVLQLAIALGLPASEAQMLALAGRLHDVGKVAVPDIVLQKPGALTEEEWALMRPHPVVGADVVSHIPALRPLAPVIRAHHERWDGQGYPDQLAGEAIPFGARILTVVDAYLAMITDRPYRKARAPAAALAELRHCASSQFDPWVVEAMTLLLHPLAEAATQHA